MEDYPQIIRSSIELYAPLGTVTWPELTKWAGSTAHRTQTEPPEGKEPSLPVPSPARFPDRLLPERGQAQAAKQNEGQMPNYPLSSTVVRSCVA